MKKRIAVLLSAVLLLMALTACGSTEAWADSQAGPPALPDSGAPAGEMPGEPPEGDPPGAPPDGNGGPGGTPPGDPPDGNGGGTPPGGFGGGMPGGPGRSSADSDGGDSCNFYGLNAAVLVKDGAAVSITGGTVTSDADGANGIFCYGGNGGQNGASGDGTTLTVRDTVITTTGNGSGGIMTTGGGTTYAYDLTVETSGRSSAAIRTDRGGGTVVADGGTYTSNGLGSPAIYSTADITVSNAKLISNLSEGVCIEGLNSITLNDCDLTASNTQRNGNATFLDSIMIYQSMSGDAASGTSHFTMTGGSLTSKSGHVFHVTNTNAVITLEGVEIVNEDADNILLSVCADGWTGGSNTAVLKAADQKLSGAVKVGSDSSLTLELTDASAFEGSIDGSIFNADGEMVSADTGTVSVTLDSRSGIRRPEAEKPPSRAASFFVHEIAAAAAQDAESFRSLFIVFVFHMLPHLGDVFGGKNTGRQSDDRDAQHRRDHGDQPADRRHRIDIPVADRCQ